MTGQAPQLPEIKHEPTRYLHFIWAGGTKLLPAKNLDIITQWITKNPGITVILWVDKQTMAAGTDPKDYYRDLLPAEIDVVDCTDIPDQPRGDKPQFEIHDVRKERLLSDYALYQMTRLDPNYGASSDDLRLAALDRYGWAYADSDVLPGDKALTQFMDEHPELFDGSCAFVTLFTQNHLVIGNDFFIASKENPIIKMFRESLAHPLQTCKIPPVVLAYGQGSVQLKMNFTIATSGPTFIRQQLARMIGGEFSHYQDIDPLARERLTEAVEAGTEVKLADGIVKLGGISEKFSKCTRNDFNWLKVPITTYDDEKEAMAAVLNTIDYELREIGIIRLDDHLSNLLTSLRKKANESPDLINRYLQQVEARIKVAPAQVKIVQLTFRYPQTEDFCRKNNLMDHTMLMHYHPQILEIIRQVCRLDDCDLYLRQKVRETPPDSPEAYLHDTSTLIETLRNAATRFLKHFHDMPAAFFTEPGSFNLYRAICKETQQLYWQMYNRIATNLECMDTVPAYEQELRTLRRELEKLNKDLIGLEKDIQALAAKNPARKQPDPGPPSCGPNCSLM